MITSNSLITNSSITGVININSNKNNENLSNSVLLNCSDNNFQFKLLIDAYEAYKSSNFELAIEKFKQLNSLAQSLVQMELSCETLLNIAIMYYYSGKLTKSYHCINESLELCESLLKKIENFDKNNKKCFFNKNNLIRIYLRILSNLIMISISMNLCDDSLSSLDTMIEYIKNLSDKFLKNEFLETIFKNMFVLPVEGDRFEKNEKINFQSKSSANFFLENDYDYGGEIFLLLKSVNAIFYGFLNFLKNEKNIDFFIKNLQESISNLNLINDHSFVSLPLVNLSLMKLIKENGSNSITSREIFRDFVKTFRNKTNHNLDEEAAYSLVINEQFQKFETAKIIFETLNMNLNQNKNDKIDKNEKIDKFGQKTEKNEKSEKIFSENIFLKLILKNLRNEILLKIRHENHENQVNEVIQDKNENFSKSQSQSQSHPLNEELSKLNLAIQLLENFQYSSQLSLSNDEDFKEVEMYYKNNLHNLMIIYRLQKLRRHFKLFMKRTLIYDNIKDYRLYVKKSIREPSLKKYFFTCLDNFRNSGYSVTKFNFSSAGKKEKFMKYESENENENEEDEMKFKNKLQNKIKNQKNKAGTIIFSSDKKFKSELKKIPVDRIKRVIFGVHTNNLKSKYPEFQKEKYKKPWLFLSLILKTDYLNNTKNSIFSKNSNLLAQKNYTSIDLFFNDENEVKEIIFSFNLLKYIYGLESLHVISNKNFMIQKMKLKMLSRIKDIESEVILRRKNSFKSNSQGINNNNENNSHYFPSLSKSPKLSFFLDQWSFIKLFLYIIKNNIKLT